MLEIILAKLGIKSIIITVVIVSIIALFINFNSYKNKQCKMILDLTVVSINKKSIEDNLEKQKAIVVEYSERIFRNGEIKKTIDSSFLSEKTIKSNKTIQELNDLRNCELHNFNNLLVKCE